MPSLILLVNANRAELEQLESLLADEGYLVSAVSSFHEAKNILHSVSPELLIADIRLEAFNGLHLAAHSRLDHPSLPVVVTHASNDVVLEGEARRLSATFVVNPLTNPEFLRQVELALGEHRRAQTLVRRWPRKHIAGIVSAQAGAAPAHVFDMSYGGLRLAIKSDLGEPPTTFDVMLPETGITLMAHRVWTGRSPTGNDIWCGAEIADVSGAVTTQWREFVDSVS